MQKWRKGDFDGVWRGRSVCRREASHRSQALSFVPMAFGSAHIVCLLSQALLALHGPGAFALISHVLEAKNLNFSCPLGNGNMGRAELCSRTPIYPSFFVRISRKHSGL